MDPSTGTFISMDSYQGSLYDPVSLHKYLYANANPVTYTDPSGYFSLAGLTTCTTASQILNASWKFITFNTIMGALTGAAFGAVDSILGGNDFSKVVQDSLKGAFSGAVLGCVISTLACFAVIYPWAFTVLQIFRGAFFITGGIGAYVSLEDGNAVQAFFRAVLAILAYRNMGKLIENVDLVRVTGSSTGTGKYEKAGLWERITVKKVDANELSANSYDEFSDPKIGPSDKAVAIYMKEINTTGKLSEPILVQKLSNGGYEIVDGHHKWLAATKTGLEKVQIKIENYKN